MNNLPSDIAPCDGTVYAWHYCYYNENSITNLEAAFGVFSFSNDNIYTLREGSYYLLHLDTRETTFTCDTLTLNSSEYFQIQAGDKVGACLKSNGDTDYLDILYDSSFNLVHIWSVGNGECTEANMNTSPQIDIIQDVRSNLLHLYLDISKLHTYMIML